MVRITLDKPYIPIPVPAVITSVKYGLLYNWYAVTDVRNIAADGWVMPEESDLVTLETYLGGYLVAGGKLKENVSTYWSSPNTGATNEVGFNAKGSGQRDATSGLFININTYGFILSITPFGPSGSTARRMYYANTELSAQGPNKKYGLPARLIRPATSSELLLDDGTSCATYVGNDGKIYRTVKIGTQVWLADNLAETKYRNGDTIPEVTDNSAWAALTTGALCAYNNDWSNVLI